MAATSREPSRSPRGRKVTAAQHAAAAQISDATT
jgi:hypothetical protein